LQQFLSKDANAQEFLALTFITLCSAIISPLALKMKLANLGGVIC